jgi:hypothetical protein
MAAEDRDTTDGELRKEDIRPGPHNQAKSTQDMLDERSGAGPIVAFFKTLGGLAIAAVVVAAIFFGAKALEGDDPPEHAPWSTKAAPDVRPDGLALQ